MYSISDDEGTYFGSTMNALSYRIKKHICDAIIYNKSGNTRRICSSHEIILRDKYQVTVVEWVAVESKEELLMKERMWIENNPGCVNKVIPIRSIEEHKKYQNDYYKSHKNDSAFIETNRKYRDANKERIKVTKQKWNKEHAEEMREYFKQRHQAQKLNPAYVQKRQEYKRKWNQSENGRASNNAYNNRPDVKERRSQMYQQKKETETEEHIQNRKQKAKKRKSKIVVCCGKEITAGSLSEHKKTQLHIKNNPS